MVADTQVASSMEGEALSTQSPLSGMESLKGVEEEESAAGFSVSLDVYQGPFDVLLSMIAQRRLEVTQLSLSEITGEFISYVSAMDLETHADEASEFLVVASILVEAKSAALLPGESEPNDEQSLEALRERDLLFARLLQYKAFKQAGENFRKRLAANSGRFEHRPYLSEESRKSLASVEWTMSPYDFALLAAKVFANAPLEHISLRQLHVPLADLQTESAVVHDKLRAARGTAVSFDDLVADTTSRGQVVARFLSLLAFFKQGFVQFKQDQAFAPLLLRWVASDEEYSAAAGISAADFA